MPTQVIAMHDESFTSHSTDDANEEEDIVSDEANEEEDIVSEQEETPSLHEITGQRLNQKPPTPQSDDGVLKSVGKPRWYTDKNGVFRKRRKPNWKVASRKAMKQFLRRGSFVLPPPRKATVN